MIVEKARDYRRENPGIGCAKLYLIIKKMFEETGCMPGRDVFIEILRKNGLMSTLQDDRLEPQLPEIPESDPGSGTVKTE